MYKCQRDNEKEIENWRLINTQSDQNKLMRMDQLQRDRNN